MHVDMGLCFYSLAVQMSGSFGGEGYRFRLTAAVQRCCLKVTRRLYSSSQNNLDFTAKWHRLQAKIENRNAFISHESGFKKSNNFGKDLNTSRISIGKDGFLFDFHYLKSPPA